MELTLLWEGYVDTQNIFLPEAVYKPHLTLVLGLISWTLADEFGAAKAVEEKPPTITIP